MAIKSMHETAGQKPFFKQCPACGFQWVSRDSFLHDPHLIIIGYQVHFEELEAGLFLFNHSCRGTLSIPAGDFKDLYAGPIFRERLTGSEECPGHCLHCGTLEPCPARCECAYVREIIQRIRSWRKQEAASA